MHTSPTAAALQRRVQSRIDNADTYGFFNLLTGPELLDEVESLLPEHRERLFPPTETLSMFMAQALSADSSCQRVVDDAAVKRLIGGLPRCSSNTAAYCKARARLPQTMVSTLARHTGELVAGEVSDGWLWRGRRVLLTDGTTLSLIDTEDNQAAYPQPNSQREGLGFPKMRLLGLLCLASGALLDAAEGPCEGKGSDEQTLFRGLLDNLAAGDVLLGEAYFPTYFLLCELLRRGVDGLFEQYGARKRSTDFRCGKRLGPKDHLIVWTKPKRPDWMSPEEYAAVPETLTVRELKVGGKILVTTFLCPKDTPKNMLKALYWRRWNVELDVRNIKDHARHGDAALSQPRDGAQGAVGLPAGLQSDPAVDGPSSSARRSSTAPAQLQAYGADLGQLAPTRRRELRRGGHARTAATDRRTARRAQAGEDRAAPAQAPAQAISADDQTTGGGA